MGLLNKMLMPYFGVLITFLVDGNNPVAFLINSICLTESIYSFVKYFNATFRKSYSIGRGLWLFGGK